MDDPKKMASYLGDVYTQNKNELAKAITNLTGVELDLINREAVYQSAMSDLAKVSIKTNHDATVNKMRMVITQSIVRGESIQVMAKGIGEALGNNLNNAVRIARTETTRVMGQARDETLQELVNEGVEVMKVWVSTNDSRTRDTHQGLQGQKVAFDKNFSNGLKYPGDQSGSASEVINCRCTMTSYFPEYEDEKSVPLAKPKKPKKVVEDKKVDKPFEVKNRNDVDEYFKMKKISVNASFENIDDRLKISNINQLSKLDHKYNVISKIPDFSILGDSGNSIASVGYKYKNVMEMKLNLSESYFKNYDDLIELEKRLRNKNWSMPFVDDSASVFSITHEYGHMLQNTFIDDVFKKKGVYAKIKEMEEKAKSYSGNDFTKVFNAYNKSYKRLINSEYKSVTRKIANEIIEIAINKNPDFDLMKNISDYGKTDTAEMFAETFANAHCGAPNELGDAMIEWLKKRGFE